MAGRQGYDAATGAGATAFAVGYACYRSCCILGLERQLAQQLWFRILSIIAFDGMGFGFQQQLFWCEAGILVFRRLSCHIEGAADQRR